MLTEAGLTEGTEGVKFFSDPATSSKIPALWHDGFQKLATYAAQAEPSPSQNCTGC